MKCVCLDDYRKLAQQKLPTNTFAYIEGGSDNQVTKKRNQRIYQNYVMIPRILRSTSNITMNKNILGVQTSVPFGFAPWAMGKLSHEKGELIPAKISYQSNMCYILSILSNVHPRQIQEVNKNGLRFMQIYLSSDWELNKKSIRIAEKYGFAGIVLTVDGQILGIRRRQLKHPLNHSQYYYPILQQLAKEKSDKPKQRISFLRQRDLTLNWEKIKEIRAITKLKIIIKGIVHPDDAILAKQVCDAIYISNHGGRQLDTVLTSIQVLPDIRKVVGKEFPVFIDGGIRTGMDIFKCLALGADYVFIGRPFAYGLIEGQEGVKNMIEILKDQLKRTMILNGPQNIPEINSSFIGFRSKI